MAKNYKNQERAQERIREFKQISGERFNWESHWEEIAERVYPAHSKLFTSKNQFQNQGNKRTDLIFDSTAPVALKRFASILDSLLTPRNQTWHRLLASDPYLNKQRDVQLYFEEVTRLLFKYRYAPEANFSMNNQQTFLSLGGYGTGCMFTDELVSGRGMRYRNIHLGEIYFVENHQGVVDKAYRHFPMSARQAMQKWKDKTPEKIAAAYGTNPETIFYFLHCVEPRVDVNPKRVDYKGMPIASFYDSMDCQEEIEEGGYGTMPYSIPRYEQAPGETYGRSPAMDVLPAIKTLNEQKKTVLKQGHRVVDPVLLVHDDGIIDTFSLKPGALNAGGVSSDGRPLVHALPTGNLTIGKDLMDDERKVINDAFLVNIFQILVESPQMTATEVMERIREKGMLLAPTMGRLQSEYLGTLVDRELDVLSRQRLLPPMPGILLEARGDYQLQYDSPLSRAQRAEEASGVMRTIEATLNVVNVTQNPEPLDIFDWDVIVPEMADIQGVPAHWMRSAEAVAKIRQARAGDAEDQKMIQAGPAAAAMVKAAAVAKKG